MEAPDEAWTFLLTGALRAALRYHWPQAGRWARNPTVEEEAPSVHHRGVLVQMFREADAEAARGQLRTSFLPLFS